LWRRARSRTGTTNLSASTRTTSRQLQRDSMTTSFARREAGEAAKAGGAGSNGNASPRGGRVLRASMIAHAHATPPRQRPQRPVSPQDPRQPTRKRQGLTQAEVRAAIAAQGGRCAIGGEPLGELAVVDHCRVCARTHGHAPERGCRSCYRAILCSAHNLALGAFRDDPDALRRAATYVGHGRH
jgi:hypothetical protein